MHTQCIYRNQRCKFSSNRENILFHTNAVSLLKYERQFVMKQEASQPMKGSTLTLGLHPDSKGLHPDMSALAVNKLTGATHLIAESLQHVL